MKYTVTRDGHVPIQLEADFYDMEGSTIVFFVNVETLQGGKQRVATFPQPCQVISEGIATVMPGGVNNDEAQARELFKSLQYTDRLPAELAAKHWHELGFAEQKDFYRAARAVLNALSGIIPKPED